MKKDIGCLRIYWNDPHPFGTTAREWAITTTGRISGFHVGLEQNPLSDGTGGWTVRIWTPVFELSASTEKYRTRKVIFRFHWIWAGPIGYVFHPSRTWYLLLRLVSGYIRRLRREYWLRKYEEAGVELDPFMKQFL